MRSPALTLTCRRWRAVFYSEPAIWRRFTLHSRRLHELPAPKQQAALAGRMALLQRVAPLVSEAEIVARLGLRALVAVAAHARLEDFIRALPGPSLTSLTLCCPHEGAAAQQAAVHMALVRLAALRQLVLECGQPPAGAPQALARLTHLHTLVLRASALSSALLASVARHLTALTELLLLVSSPSAGLPDGLTALPALSLLQRLVRGGGWLAGMGGARGRMGARHVCAALPAQPCPPWPGGAPPPLFTTTRPNCLPGRS